MILEGSIHREAPEGRNGLVGMWKAERPDDVPVDQDVATAYEASVVRVGEDSAWGNNVAWTGTVYHTPRDGSIVLAAKILAQAAMSKTWDKKAVMEKDA